MKNTTLALSCVAGYENLVVWADLLDCINVFPVADGDTGTNLRISLAPLRDQTTCLTPSVLSGIGNSGNIAVAFLQEFLKQDGELAIQAVNGRDLAYSALHKPVQGTMLDVYDALCKVLAKKEDSLYSLTEIRTCLQNAVKQTMQQLPDLEEAGVVDSGALGMFVFFDGFFQQYLEGKAAPTPVMELFEGALQIASSYQPQHTEEYCVDAVLAVDTRQTDIKNQISSLGESAVVVSGEHGTKVHLHTRNPSELQKELSSLGRIVNWSDTAMDPMQRTLGENRFQNNKIKIISDAAGSIPLALARKHGIILLDSYIVAAGHATPESLFSAEKLYSLMETGGKVSTAQASDSERRLHYQAACAQHSKLLYICTGSAFTGNFSSATAWKEKTKGSENLQTLDSGAASGRLAVIAILTARFAETGASAHTVQIFAEVLTRKAEEYVFIDELRYLVAGGRVSKAKGFFAGLLNMKPVISPGFEGVRKMGVVRSRKSQIDFALEKLKAGAVNPANLFVLLQYTNNKTWLSTKVEHEIHDAVPLAEIMSVPLSLTSGVHMGPGTWSIAFADKGECR